MAQSIELALLYPDANIIAFECNPASVLICRNILAEFNKKNKIKFKIHLIERAVFNKNEEINFYSIDLDKSIEQNLGASSVFEIDRNNITNRLTNVWFQNKIKVPAITIDYFRKEYLDGKNIDLIWVDIQGAELLALQGMKESLENIKAIITEVGEVPYYKGHTLFPDVNEYLISKNFILVYKDACHDFESSVVYINKKFIKQSKLDWLLRVRDTYRVAIMDDDNKELIFNHVINRSKLPKFENFAPINKIF